MVGQKIMIGNEILERVKEYTYSGQTVSANPMHEIEIKCRTEMGWSAIGKHDDIVKAIYHSL